MNRPASTGALLPILILLLLGITWGGLANVSKWVGLRGVPALSYTFWVTFGAGLLLLVVNWLRRRPPPLDARHLRYYLLIGATMSAIPTSVMFWAVRHLPVGQVTMVLATSPLMTYLLALLLGMESFRRHCALGIALGFGGALLLVGSRGVFTAGADGYLLVAFVTPLFYAVSGLLAARLRPPQADSLVLAGGMLLASAGLLLVVTLAVEPLYPLWQGPPAVSALLGVHMSAGALAFTLTFFLLKLAGPVYFSQVAYLVTLFGIGFGMLVFDERHPPGAWAALLLIFAGIALVNRRTG